MSTQIPVLHVHIRITYAHKCLPSLYSLHIYLVVYAHEFQYYIYRDISITCKYRFIPQHVHNFFKVLYQHGGIICLLQRNGQYY